MGIFTFIDTILDLAVWHHFWRFIFLIDYLVSYEANNRLYYTSFSDNIQFLDKVKLFPLLIVS